MVEAAQGVIRRELRQKVVMYRVAFLVVPHYVICLMLFPSERVLSRQRSERHVQQAQQPGAQHPGKKLHSKA